jgi:uncharacterized protein (DUF2062 family)
MPKKFFKKYVPAADELKNKKHFQCLGSLLHMPSLWHFNRQSVSGGFAVGLFMAWVPLPGQMILAALAAIFFRVNLPISVALIWITNPVTIIPLFSFAYKLGSWVLGEKPQIENVKMSMEWLMNSIGQIGLPITIGSLILGIVSALIGYFSIQLLWRIHIIRRWKERSMIRLKKKNDS